MQSKVFDVIVVGVGSMGSAACCYLAKAGLHVLGLEQFTIPNDLASHAGQTRIIRKAYFEHPDYVPLLQRAYENWKALEIDSGEKLYFETGLLYAGEPNGALIGGVTKSAKLFGLPVERLTRERFPQFNILHSFDILYEPEAGFIIPEKAISTFRRLSEKSGAAILDNTVVKQWKRESDVFVVQTNRGAFKAKKIVITSGPWTSMLVPQMQSKLSVTRQILGWFEPIHSQKFEMGSFPCWLIENPSGEGVFYGFPLLDTLKFGEPYGVKLALHFPGEVTDPNKIIRVATHEDVSYLKSIAESIFPDHSNGITASKVCMYTNTADENFIIDFLPGTNNDVVIASGFSGHGFKFAAVVGEIISELVLTGKTKQPIDFIRMSRFH